jgi:hypothetical protein
MRAFCRLYEQLDRTSATGARVQALVEHFAAAAPADAEPDVRALCHWVSSRRGGHGAVREFAETLLEWRGQRSALLARYRDGHGRSAG